MKKQIVTFTAGFCMLYLSFNAQSQSLSVDGLFEKALSLTQKGDHEASGNALGLAAIALEKEAGPAGSPLNSKLLGQVNDLKAIIPLASQGKIKGDALSKLVNKVKLLIGINRLNNSISGGKKGLLGNSSSLLNNLALVKAGSSALGGNVQSGKVENLIGKAMKSVGKLDKKGLLANLAAGASKRKLGRLVSLVQSGL